MGILSRRSGAAFEREVAAFLREVFPEFAHQIRRGLQAHKAFESDVTGVPGLWVECQFAKQVNPKKKLEQAERDVEAAQIHARPIVIYRQKGLRGEPRLRAVHRTYTGGIESFPLDHIPGAIRLLRLK